MRAITESSSVMNAIKDMMQINYTTFIVWIFALLFGIKEIIELLSYFKRKFGVKTTLDTNKESMENRIATLEKHDDIMKIMIIIYLKVLKKYVKIY